jgi:hypothetical protein
MLHEVSRAGRELLTEPGHEERLALRPPGRVFGRGAQVEGNQRALHPPPCTYASTRRLPPALSVGVQLVAPWGQDVALLGWGLGVGDSRP